MSELFADCANQRKKDPEPVSDIMPVCVNFPLVKSDPMKYQLAHSSYTSDSEHDQSQLCSPVTQVVIHLLWAPDCQRNQNS